MKYILYAYVIIGFIYAMYILLFAGDPWHAFLINMIFGPAYIIKEIYKAITYKGKPTFKEIFKKKDVVVFDLDGTLIDSHEYWKAAFIKVGIEKKLDLTDVRKGAGVREKWSGILEYNDKDTGGELLDELDALTKKYFLEFLPQELEPIDGFWALARELKEEKEASLVLASNTDKEVVDEVIKRLDMENVFDFVIGGDEVKKRKPAPEIYKAVAKKFKSKPKNMLVFEDSPTGSEASVAAGMDTIVIWDTEKVREFYPKEIKLYVPDFTPFPGSLDKTYKQMVEEAAELVQEYNIDFE